jgi:hypothetical protein
MKIIGAVVSPILSVLGLTPKAPKMPAPTPTATRDDARAQIASGDALKKRRGGAADMLSGAGGAEAGGGGKDTLGS